MYFKPGDAKKVYDKLTTNLFVRTGSNIVLLSEQVNQLCKAGVVSMISNSSRVYPSFIFVIKQKGKDRLIFDMKDLNEHISLRS